MPGPSVTPACTEDSPEFLYGSAFKDRYLLTDPETLPRFGHLVRRAMMHYLGDRYNPHLHGLTHEVFLRQMVKEIIAYKVLYKRPVYDWDWIDQSFRKYFRGCCDVSLLYDQKRIDAGLSVDARAPQLIDWISIN